jgi:hypothetical protein
MVNRDFIVDYIYKYQMPPSENGISQIQILPTPRSYNCFNKMDDLIILLIALAVHEFGHYIHYLVLGFKPRLKWIGIGPCIDPEVKNIAIKHVLVNIFVAITFGIIVINVAHASNIALFAYIVGCFLDLNNAQMLLIYVWRKTITFDTNVNNIKIVVTK